MSQSSAVAAVMLALTTRMRAVSGYRNPYDQTSSGRPVYLAHEAALHNPGPGTSAFLVIAYMGDPSRQDTSANTAQVQATQGTTRSRAEVGVVRCLAAYDTADVGDGLVAAALTACLGLVDDVDTAIRADPSLGLVPTFREVTAALGALPAVVPTLGSGVGWSIEFEVGFTARI